MTCPACKQPMALTDVRLLASLDAGTSHPKNGQPVTGAVKVFACINRKCPEHGRPAEQRTGTGDYEFPVPQ